MDKLHFLGYNAGASRLQERLSGTSWHIAVPAGQ